jgi:hypothetical protein
MLLKILRTLKRFAAEVAFVGLEGDVNPNM